MRVISSFLIGFDTSPQKGIHTWYFKSSPKSIDREVTDSSEEAVALVLLMDRLCWSNCLLVNYACKHKIILLCVLVREAIYLQWSVVTSEIYE